MKIDADVDIDVADRDKLLALVPHIPSSMRNVKPIRKHSTGVHITELPYDPIHDMAAIDYKEATERGYFKLDILNVHVYSKVTDEHHLERLMQEPDWSMLNDKHIVNKLIHINKHYKTLKLMHEPVNSIPRLAMFLAVIRPSKKHLIGRSWREVSRHVWEQDPDGYQFKRSHACAYAHLVVVHMNLLKGIK